MGMFRFGNLSSFLRFLATSVYASKSVSIQKFAIYAYMAHELVFKD
jgi:hypothetical protein